MDDVEAILQASESDDDDYLDPNAKPISIEDILKEDDEDNFDDYNFDYSIPPSVGVVPTQGIGDYTISRNQGTDNPSPQEYGLDADLDAKMLDEIMREAAEEGDTDVLPSEQDDVRRRVDVDKILLDFAETEDDLDIPLTNYSPGQADSLLNSLASAFSMKGTSSSLPGMKMQMNHPQSMLQMAEARERRLLSVGNKDMASPLQVKRRLRLAQRSRTNTTLSTDPATLANSKVASAMAKLGMGTPHSSSGAVKVRPLENISLQLQKNAQHKQRGPGLPTAIAIHTKFIAIGTSRSIVLVFDHFQEVRQMLGNTTESNDGPVTAIDVSVGSDFLVCGYNSGRIVLWNIMTGSSLKAVSDAHKEQISSVRFWRDKKPCIVSIDKSGVSNKITFSQGALTRMANYYSYTHECLLDGSAGQIPSLAVLLPPPTNDTSVVLGTEFTAPTIGGGNFIERYALLTLSNNTRTFVIGVEPDVKMLYKWAKPEGTDPSMPLLPSLSFSWVTLGNSNSSHGGNYDNVHSLRKGLRPVIARGWGNHVQLLQVNYTSGQQWPSFEQREQLVTSSPVKAVQWLTDQVLVYLNSNDEVCIFDCVVWQELEVVDISAVKLVYANISHPMAKNADGTGTGALTTACSFANSFRACERKLYFLGVKELREARLQSWKQRIDVVKEDGEWLEALALALDHFETQQKAHTPSERAEAAAAVVETNGQVPKHVATHVADLLMSYVTLAITNAPVSTTERESLGSDSETLRGKGATARLDLARSHYQMLGGVCIEFCVVIGRLDLLFGEIFRNFQRAHRQGLFVELLEPYLLNDKIRALRPEVMEALVQHYTNQGMVERVEQCLLHMDVKHLDYDSVVRLCREQQLYSALIYVHNSGMDDYLTPVDVLLAAMDRTEAACEVKHNADGNSDDLVDSTHAIGAFWGPFQQYGFRLLLYISFCFTGKAFPRGEVHKGRLPSLRFELLDFLVEDAPTPLSNSTLTEAAAADLVSGETNFLTKRWKACPRLRALLLLDTSEVLRILSDLFDARDAAFDSGHYANEDTNVFADDSTERGRSPSGGIQDVGNSILSRQRVVDALVNTMLSDVSQPTPLSSSGPARSQQGIRQNNSFTEEEVGCLFVFVARCMANGSIHVDSQRPAFIDRVLSYLALGKVTGKSSSGTDVGGGSVGSFLNSAWRMTASERESMLVKLLEKLPNADDVENVVYDADKLLPLVTEERQFRAQVALHKRKRNYMAVLTAYLADPEAEFKMELFPYLRKEGGKALKDKLVEDAEEVARGVNTGGQGLESGADAIIRRIKAAVLAKLVEMVRVDVASTASVVLELFPKENSHVFSLLGQKDSALQFEYLDHVMTAAGAGNTVDDGEDGGMAAGNGASTGNGSAGGNATPLITAELREQYIQLLCKHKPSQVLPYLQKNLVRQDDCLRLCKEFNIVDAEAYLLEQTGDVVGALSLILDTVDAKLRDLQVSDVLHQISLSSHRTPSSAATTTRLHSHSSGGSAIMQGIVASSGNSSNGEGSPPPSIRALLEQTSEGRQVLSVLDMASQVCERNSAQLSRRPQGDEESEKLWFALLDKFVQVQTQMKRDAGSDDSASSANAAAMQIALNEFIRIILDSMAGYVSLRSILYKITHDHCDDYYGEFRHTIEGMLDTYSYEQSIFSCATELRATDLHQEGETLRRQRAQPLRLSQIRFDDDAICKAAAPMGRIVHTEQSTRKYLKKAKINRRKEERQKQKRKTKIELLDALTNAPVDGPSSPTNVSDVCIVDCYWEPTPSSGDNDDDDDDGTGGMLVVVPVEEIALTPQGLADPEKIPRRIPGSLPKQAVNQKRFQAHMK